MTPLSLGKGGPKAGDCTNDLDGRFAVTPNSLALPIPAGSQQPLLSARLTVQHGAYETWAGSSTH